MDNLEFLKGNWPLAETLQVYCPWCIKSTSGGVEIYPLALNPEDQDDAVWLYSDPEETSIMQGSWIGMLATLAGHGYEMETDQEYRATMAYKILARKRGEYDKRSKRST